jgi:hypothetical protein
MAKLTTWNEFDNSRQFGDPSIEIQPHDCALRLLRYSKSYNRPDKPDYQKNNKARRVDTYASHGEDGILEEIFLNRLNIQKGIACEFGAWDGMTFSNTYNLVKNYGWRCHMIESDPEKAKELRQTASKPGVDIIPYEYIIDYKSRFIVDDKTNPFVPVAKQTITLEEFFEEIKISPDFDLLSIDVDGPDYPIWQSLENYHPKIVIIEANNNDLDIIYKEGAHHKVHMEGSTSFNPMKKLGESKGYTLLTFTNNMIFARNDIFEKLKQFKSVSL